MGPEKSNNPRPNAVMTELNKYTKLSSVLEERFPQVSRMSIAMRKKTHIPQQNMMFQKGSDRPKK